MKAIAWNIGHRATRIAAAESDAFIERSRNLNDDRVAIQLIGQAQTSLCIFLCQVDFYAGARVNQAFCNARDVLQRKQLIDMALYEQRQILLGSHA